MMSGGESDLAVIDNNLEKEQRDVAISIKKSLLKIDSLKRTGIATKQAGSAAQTASLIKAGGTLMGGYADYKG